MLLNFLGRLVPYFLCASPSASTIEMAEEGEVVVSESQALAAATTTVGGPTETSPDAPETPPAGEVVVSQAPVAAAVGGATSEKSPGKRIATKPSGTPPAAKRQKKVEDDLICPITLELPIDPVHAEDGSLYERWAIAEYFSKKGEGLVKSPAKGKMMGQTLLEAPHIKNIIETSIENGTITEDLASTWKEKEKLEKHMKDLVQKAEGGDVTAMLTIANRSYKGLDDFKIDQELAYKWYQKAHAAGSTIGMYREGEFLIEGIGGATKDVEKGLTYLHMAEGYGSKHSDFAAYLLGYYYYWGDWGVPLDKGLARRFLEKSLSDDCHYQHQSVRSKWEWYKDAQELLNELVAMKELLKKADEGDVAAMGDVAVAYEDGTKGFKKDYTEAFKWYQKAHAAGSILGMAKEGEYLVDGLGVAKNFTKGKTYLDLAEGRGSDVAAYILGAYFAAGMCGYPVDKVLARRFLEKSLSNECLFKHMHPSTKQHARQLLDGLVNADGN